MTLNDIQQIPFREKKQLVSSTCIMYKKIKALSNITGDPTNSFNEEMRNRAAKSLKSLSIFEVIMGLLSEQEYFIIESEFLNNDIVRDKRWSKTTYYKIKHSAVNNFVYLFFA